MSRRIPAHTTAVTAQSSSRITDGKLLLTTVKNHSMTLLVRNNRLIEAIVPDAEHNRAGSIYLGKVKKLQKNIDACFVEIADKELVYLPLAKCTQPILTNRCYDGRLLEGDELVIQLERDAQKTKLAAASAFLTLTGRYAVFHTGSEKAGISSKLTSSERTSLTKLLIRNGFMNEHFLWLSNTAADHTNTAADHTACTAKISAVIRTEAAKAGEEEVLSELRFLQNELLSLLEKAGHSTCFTCLLDTASPWESSISSIPLPDYTEAVTDLPEVYHKLKSFFHKLGKPFRFYEDQDYSLSKLYGLDSKVEEALSRRIWLKSGAYLVMDITEALTVFDVNSGKFEARKASAEAFYQINQEAAQEIARQIRLRSLSGIILVDFINMEQEEQKAALIAFMKQALKEDPVPAAVIDITPLGLMEITRKKLRKSLAEQLHTTRQSSDTE